MAPPTRCRAVKSRQAAPASQAAIWVTDVMLRQAIEHYQRRFLVTNRPLSSHRGPLECKRRPLGKRNMTDIMASPPPYQPTWWFELMGNKNAWQWQSPTTSQSRREMEGKLTLSGAADRFLKWLEASDLDKPFLTPPAATEDLIESKELTETETIKSIAIDDAPKPGLFGELDCLWSDIVQMDRISLADLKALNPLTPTPVATGNETFDTLLQNYHQALYGRLQRGDFTIEDISKMFQPPSSMTNRRRLPKLKEQLIHQHLSSILISAVAAVRRHQSGELYETAWSAVVNNTFSARTGIAKFSLFRALANEATHSRLPNIDNTLCLRMVDEFSRAARSEDIAPFWLIQIASFTQALDSLGQGTLHQVNKRLREHIWDESLIRGRRLTGLLLLSQSKHTSQDDITNTIGQLADSGFVLTASEMQKVSAARMISSGSLNFQAYSDLVEAQSGRVYRNWTQLAAKLSETGRHDDLRNLISWTRQSFNSDIVLRSPILTLIFSGHGQRLEPGYRALAAIIDDPAIDHKTLHAETARVSNQLVAKSMRPRSKAEHGHVMAQRKKLSDLLKFMADRYFLAKNLTDRQVLTGLEACMKCFEGQHNGRGSEEMLVHVAKVITRDLEAGRWGRSSRLDWLIMKVEAYKGTKQARDTLISLQRWRRMIRPEAYGKLF